MDSGGAGQMSLLLKQGANKYYSSINMDTKKEAGVSKQEVEKKYGLDKVEKTEFVKQIVKELRKYEDKLHRVANYEEMQKQGKTVNQEMQGLINQRPEFETYLKALKNTVTIYIKSLRKPGEPEPVVKDPEAELHERIHEFSRSAAKHLAYFLAMGAAAADKDRMSQSPLVLLPAEQQNEIAQAFGEIVHAPLEKDTSVREEADRLESIVCGLLEGHEGAAKIVISAMNDTALATMRFKLSAPKAPQTKEYSVTQDISVGKVVPAPMPEPVAVPVPEPKKEPVAAPVPQEKPAEEKPKVEAEKPKEVTTTESKWANDMVDEEEAPAASGAQEEDVNKQFYQPVQSQAGQEEEFTIAGEEKKPRAMAGRFRGRRRGGYPRHFEGASRGDFGGRRRPYRGGRGEGRGETRGARVSHQ